MKLTSQMKIMQILKAKGWKMVFQANKLIKNPKMGQERS